MVSPKIGFYIPMSPGLGAPVAMGKDSREGGVLKSGYPGSDGEPGCGFSWLLGGHPGGVTRLPGAAWRAGQIQSAKMKKEQEKKKSLQHLVFPGGLPSKY